MNKFKIHTETLAGNVHQVATTINRWGWAEYLISITHSGGSYSTAVFRMPSELVYALREKYAGKKPVNHDDCKRVLGT